MLILLYLLALHLHPPHGLNPELAEPLKLLKPQTERIDTFRKENSADQCVAKPVDVSTLLAQPSPSTATKLGILNFDPKIP